MLPDSEFGQRLRALAEPYQGKPVIVHADLLRTSRFLPRAATREEYLRDHAELLDSLDVELLVPAFNYSFFQAGQVDLREAPVEVGPLGRYMMERWARWRSPEPAISFLRKHAPSSLRAVVSPLVAFGNATDFGKVCRDEGAVLMYGATTAVLTLVHHAEVTAGGAVYRYDKLFSGTMVTWEGESHVLDYVYHARPPGLEYDDAFVLDLLVEAGAVGFVFDERRAAGYMLDARKAVAALHSVLAQDPLRMITAASRAWVAPLLQRLGRPFTVRDFEHDHVA